MIVLGPMDANLNGAPPYWRTVNWRPYTRAAAPANACLPTLPFDKCDLVYEYDARIPKAPLPADQGWSREGGADSDWVHDPARGVLRFSIKEGVSFWIREEKAGRITPDRAVACGLFLIQQDSGNTRQGGLDFVVEASRDEGRTRGMRANWTNRFLYRSLDGGNFLKVSQPSAEPTLLRAWHQMALDAELSGADVNIDGIEKDDGGKTIGSLDGLINNDNRNAFGYGKGGSPLTRAVLGKTDGPGSRRRAVAEFLCVVLRTFPARELSSDHPGQADPAALRVLRGRRPRIRARQRRVSGPLRHAQSGFAPGRAAVSERAIGDPAI